MTLLSLCVYVITFMEFHNVPKNYFQVDWVGFTAQTRLNMLFILTLTVNARFTASNAKNS